ncbi:MAG TPA: iron ABC transporter permease [Candidatus Ozemobacteraceae bacterium]|nr:iron ABC transporter permease [Candidatus Ozemobacteraceae bacterium]
MTSYYNDTSISAPSPSNPGKRRFWLYLTLVLLLAALAVFSLQLGNYHVPAEQTWKLFVSWLSGEASVPSPDYSSVVVLKLRLPRIIMVLLVGATLGMTGCVAQGLFRNPLVSPFILGISAGASFGAAFAIVFLSRIPFSLDVMASLGGFAAVFAAYMVARRSGRGVPRLALVLSGVIVSSFFSALVGILQYIADAETQLPAITFWMLGGFGTIAWESLFPGIYVIPASLALLLVFSWQLNILSMGDGEAMSLGMNVERWKLLFVVLVVTAVGSSVSRSGIIGWVGLIVPHISRAIVGPDHRHSLPVSGLLGAMLLLVADDLARTLTSGEIPIGIITALIGTPFFVFIMRTREKELWH